MPTGGAALAKDRRVGRERRGGQTPRKASIQSPRGWEIFYDRDRESAREKEERDREKTWEKEVESRRV